MEDQLATARGNSECSSLREHLVNAARYERQRLLGNGRQDVATLSSSPGSSTFRRNVSCQTSTLGVRRPIPTARLGWTDEDAQADAVAKIKELGKRNAQSILAEEAIADLEHLLHHERSAMMELETTAAQVSKQRAAVEKQVVNLEAEMDAKEAAIQLARQALEWRSTELNNVTRSIQELQTRTCTPRPSQDMESLQRKVDLANQELKNRDHHLNRLISVLKRVRDDLEQKDSELKYRVCELEAGDSNHTSRSSLDVTQQVDLPFARARSPSNTSCRVSTSRQGSPARQRLQPRQPSRQQSPFREQKPLRAPSVSRQQSPSRQGLPTTALPSRLRSPSQRRSITFPAEGMPTGIF